MLAVHWSPVKNTKVILRNGIRRSVGETFCFPLTGQPYVDKFWARAFRQWRPRTAYNGFVFRVVEDDLPAAFSDWPLRHDSFDKPLTSLAQIQAEFEGAIMFRLGERQFGYSIEASVKQATSSRARGGSWLPTTLSSIWTLSIAIPVSWPISSKTTNSFFLAPSQLAELCGS